MIQITAIPALKDNYIWLLQATNSNHCVIIDPGEAAPVLAVLDQRKLKPVAILITHHHWDHTNGIPELLQHYPMPVYGSAKDNISHCDHPLQGEERIYLPELNLPLQVIPIPGHTLGHVAYYSNGWVFTGDTLFTAGCGKVFEGTMPMMYQSLQKLSALPPDTLIYCGHEYTANNLKFAAAVEPDNAEIQARIAMTAMQRDKGLPTVPAPLLLELATNPFLRCEKSAVFSAAERYSGQKISDFTEIFAVLRHWKDKF